MKITEPKTIEMPGNITLLFQLNLCLNELVMIFCSMYPINPVRPMVNLELFIRDFNIE